MRIHAQTQVDLDRRAIRMLSGSDQHVAITNSITTLITLSIRLVRVCSYRDGGRELFSIVFGAIGMKVMSRQRGQGSLHFRAFEARPVSSIFSRQVIATHTVRAVRKRRA